jgi:hypothetical protein
MRTELLAALAALLIAGPATAQRAPVAPLPPATPAAIPAALALMLQGTGGDRVVTGDHTVAEGESVADIVVVGGTLRVLGEVTGDALVVGGDLVVASTGRIAGDALVTGGAIQNEGGEIRGEMRTLSGDGELSREIRRTLAGVAAGTAGREAAAAGRDAARAARDAARVDRRITVREQRRAQRGWFDPIRRGFAGVISTLAMGLVLGGIGAALIFYGRPYLDNVSDTLRTSVGRSAVVGLATGFLIVPAFVVMVVALAVSIVGIPLLLVAVPLYPLAVAAAVALGLLAAAHAIGERTAEQSDSYSMRHRNAYTYLFTGLTMLLTPLMLAHLIVMTGFLSFIGTLLKVVTGVVIWATATAGLGAVVLSRGGTRRTFARPLATEPEDFDDALFEDEPAPRGGGHV